MAVIMILKNKTEYNYENVKDFTKYSQGYNSTAVFIIFIVCCVIMVASYIIGGILGDESDGFTGNWFVIFWSVMAVLYVIMLILQEKNAKKTAEQNIIAEFEFNDTEILVTSVSSTEKSATRAKYDLITKVTRSKKSYFLFIRNSVSAFIISKNGFTEGTAEDFETLLRVNLEPKKIKFKNK